MDIPLHSIELTFSYLMKLLISVSSTKKTLLVSDFCFVLVEGVKLWISEKGVGWTEY